MSNITVSWHSSTRHITPVKSYRIYDKQKILSPYCKQLYTVERPALQYKDV